MEKIWADEVINETIWKSFVSKLLDEWNGLILWVRFQIALVTGGFDPQVMCYQSAVLLSVNVGLLAVPGVTLYNINGDDLESVRQLIIFPSSSQIASALSLQASIGSIVIGLLLVRHNRPKQEADPSEAVSDLSHPYFCGDLRSAQATYLDQNSRTPLGLEPMAIIFSLPWALLMWSYVISF